MPIRSFTAKHFRCLTSIALEADPQYNLIHGPNASGKTSILEAIAYLGRGKSFRGAAPQQLIQHDASQLELTGKIDTGTRVATVGLRNGPAGLEVKIDTDRATSAAALAEVLPLQVLDPEIHQLVAGGPEQRRRYLDWIAFHVEPGYAGRWRRFRRALKQRNAALREARPAMASWDREFLQSAQDIHRSRQRVLAESRELLEKTAGRLLGCPVRFEYRAGWGLDQSLQEALAAGWERDRAGGATTAGPQRAELELIYDERQARRLVSRGQQKLLASALILAASEIVQKALQRPLLLLLDDPAAELDEPSLDRLMAAVFELDCQIVATALEPETLHFPAAPRRFHVEQGQLRQLV